MLPETSSWPYRMWREKRIGRGLVEAGTDSSPRNPGDRGCAVDGCGTWYVICDAVRHGRLFVRGWEYASPVIVKHWKQWEARASESQPLPPSLSRSLYDASPIDS